MTNEELQQRLDSLVSRWEQGFTPLFLAVNSIKSVMEDRIFENGKNTAGIELPSPGYSTKEIYVDVNTLPNTPSSYQVGKTGKKIKSAYFPNGYKQLKQVVGRPVLKLTNRLFSAFTNYPVLESGTTAVIALPDDEKEKRIGLEKKYGTIFQMTDEETELFTEILQFEITEAINRAIQ